MEALGCFSIQCLGCTKNGILDRRGEGGGLCLYCDFFLQRKCFFLSERIMFFGVTVGVQGHAPEIEKDIWSANPKARNCFIEALNYYCVFNELLMYN